MGKFTTKTQWVYSDGTESVSLHFQPAEHIEPKFDHSILDGSYEIVYAVQDSDTEQPYTDEDDAGVWWNGFDTREEAAEFVKQCEERGHFAYRFNHNTHGPMSNNVLDPDGRFVLQLCEDWVASPELAQNILNDFTAWQNGDTYMIVRQWTEGPYNEEHTDHVGGYIGTEYVQELVAKGGDF